MSAHAYESRNPLIEEVSQLVLVETVEAYVLSTFWRPLCQHARSRRICPIIAINEYAESRYAAEVAARAGGARPWSELRDSLPIFFGENAWLASEMTRRVGAASRDPQSRRAAIEELVAIAQHLDAASEPPSPPLLKQLFQGDAPLTRTAAPALGRALVAVRNDEFAWAGAVFALLERRPVVLFDDWEEIRDRASSAWSSVTIFTAPDAVTVATTDRLHGYARGPLLRSPFGIMTARTLPALTRLAARTILNRGAPRLRNKLVVETMDALASTPAFELVRAPDFTRSAGERLLAEEHDLVALGAHGDPIDANLAEAILCGKGPSSSAIPNPQDPVHTCQNSDFCRRDVKQRLFRLPIEDIRCKVLFSETCTGIGVSRGVFPGALSLALGALDRWACAYLSTTKIIRSTLIGPLLIHALLESGMTLGEATQWMSVVHLAVSHDQPGFLLLGDANFRLRSEGAVPVVRIDDVGRDGSANVEGRGAEGYVIRVDFEGEKAREMAEWDDWAASLEPLDAGSSAARHCIVVPRGLGAPLSVVIFDTAPFELGRVRVVFERSSRGGAELATFLRVVDRNVSHIGYLHGKLKQAEGLRDGPTLQKLADDLRFAADHATTISRRGLRLLSMFTHQVVRASRRAQPDGVPLELEDAIAACDAFLAAEWPSWQMPHYTASFYEGFLFPVREREAGPCYLCGNQTFDFVLDCAARPELRRVVTHCSRCGVLSDRAEEERLVEILGPSEVVAGDRVVQEVSVKPDGARGARYSASMSFEGRMPWFSSAITPESLSFVASGTEPARAAFEIAVSPESLEGIYNLVVVTVHRLGMNVSVKPLRVRRRERSLITV